MFRVYNQDAEQDFCYKKYGSLRVPDRPVSFKATSYCNKFVVLRILSYMVQSSVLFNKTDASYCRRVSKTDQILIINNLKIKPNLIVFNFKNCSNDWWPFNATTHKTKFNFANLMRITTTPTLDQPSTTTKRKWKTLSCSRNCISKRHFSLTIMADTV